MVNATRINEIRNTIWRLQREWRGDGKQEIAIPIFYALLDLIEEQQGEIEKLRLTINKRAEISD